MKKKIHWMKRQVQWKIRKMKDVEKVRWEEKADRAANKRFKEK